MAHAAMIGEQRSAPGYIADGGDVIDVSAERFNETTEQIVGRTDEIESRVRPSLARAHAERRSPALTMVEVPINMPTSKQRTAA